MVRPATFHYADPNNARCCPPKKEDVGIYDTDMRHLFHELALQHEEKRDRGKIGRDSRRYSEPPVVVRRRSYSDPTGGERTDRLVDRTEAAYKRTFNPDR